jgi:hypothetical protein
VAGLQAIDAAIALGFRAPAGYEWSKALADRLKLADVDPKLVVGEDPVRRDVVTVTCPGRDEHGDSAPDIGFHDHARRFKKKKQGQREQE